VQTREWVIVCAILSIVLATAGCSQGTPAGNPAPAGVEVVEVQQKDVPIYGEWIGTLDGLVNADIKAEVSGYLLKQNYTEGSFVRKGQLFPLTWIESTFRLITSRPLIRPAFLILTALSSTGDPRGMRIAQPLFVAICQAAFEFCARPR
jgi:hypothetical protein